MSARELTEITKEQVRAWRQRLGVTQSEAARKIGVGLRLLQGMEGGEAKVSTTVALAMIAAQAGLDISEM